MSINKNKKLSFGGFLKSHRLGEELSQVQFAELLNISKQRLCDIEKNRSTVSIKLAKQVAELLDMPPEWLVKLALQDQIDREGLDLKVS